MSSNSSAAKSAASSWTTKTLGDELWANRVEKMNLEFFVLTYGSLVMQLMSDFAWDNAKVNQHLDDMGYRIGTRLVEEFIVKSGVGRCRNFRETADTISRVAFRMFLNISPQVINVSQDGRSFCLQFDENPLAEHVELPQCAMRTSSETNANAAASSALGVISPLVQSQPASAISASAPGAKLSNAAASNRARVRPPLWYSNVICGALRGALEMLQMQCEVRWISDQLLGDETSEIYVRLVRVLADEVPPGE